MFGLQFLDLVIGVVFIFLLYSLAVSTIREMYSNFLNLRAKNLQKWVKESLESGGFGDKILNHPLVQGISIKGRKPSYIPPKLFGEVFLQIIHDENGDGNPYDVKSLKAKIKSTDYLPTEFKTFLLQRLEDTKDNVEALKDSIEEWFDSAMLRIGGTYKKNSQRFLLFASLILVTWTNMDTFRLINYFHTNPAAATAVADRAEQFVQDTTVIAYINSLKPLDTANVGQSDGDSILLKLKSDYLKLKDLNAEAKSLDLPIGWKSDPWIIEIGNLPEKEKAGILEKKFWQQRWPIISGFFSKLAGLLMSGLAISLGAPFWFETLNKLVNLRGAGKDPKKGV